MTKQRKNLEDQIRSIRIAEILADPFQPRKNFNEESIEELAISIKENGLLSPICLRRLSDEDKTDENIVGVENLNTDAKYMIVAGERRFRAFKFLNKKTIPSLVKSFDNLDSIRQLQIIENLQRKNVGILEEASAFFYLNDSISAEEIAKRVGKSTPYIYQRLKLHTLVDPFKVLLSKKYISLGIALKLTDFSIDAQNSLYSILDQNYNLDSRIQDYIIKRYLNKSEMSLSNATWCLESKNVANDQSCSLCSSNTANRGFLFSDEKDTCLNTACFNLKKINTLLDFIEDRKKDGVKVVFNRYNMDNVRDDESIVRGIFLDKNFQPFHTTYYDNIEDILSKSVWMDEYYYGDLNEKEEVNEAYSEYVNDTKESNDELKSKIEKGEVTKVFMLDLTSTKYKIAYVDPSLFEKASNAGLNIDQPLSKIKMDQCTPTQKIQKIQEREARKKVIEGEKMYKDLIQIDPPRNTPISRLEKLTFIASGINAYRYRFYSYRDDKTIDKLENLKGKDGYEFLLSMSEKEIDQAVYSIMRLFIDNNAHTPSIESSHVKDMSCMLYRDHLIDVSNKEYSQIHKEYYKRERDREHRAAQRIEELIKLS